MRGKITKRIVDALKPGESCADTEIKGFVVRRLPSGTTTYGFRYRDKASGSPRWLALGLHGNITPDEARDLAKKRAGAVADRRDPATEYKAEREKAKRAAGETVDAVLDAYLDRHARPNLRGQKAIERAFNAYVRPKLGRKSIYELRRSDIVEMLDAVEDEGGPVMADRTLAYLRTAFNWRAARDDAFVPPIARGMARTKAKDRARDRVLADDEIRDVWTALEGAEAPVCYARYIRALLLTGQRRTEVAQMEWREVDGEVWTIPGERYKTKRDHLVPLSTAVRGQLGKAAKKGYVFSSTNGKRPFSGFGKAKTALDATIAQTRKQEKREEMPRWTLHDLRRTARSLMSRAGVSSDIAERVLGHEIPGVRGVYDRYAYLDEKRDALDRLAALVERIANPASVADAA